MNRTGLTVFFTGLSGAGKSTLAELLQGELEKRDRTVTMLDGDVVRTHISKGLGFSKEDRSANIRRIGFVAAEITRHGGIAICAPIAPYEEDRAWNRKEISKHGAYFEVYVATPIAECERRDIKGLYAKARRGEIPTFTGVSDPYEPPSHPELALDTTGQAVEACLSRILQELEKRKYI